MPRGHAIKGLNSKRAFPPPPPARNIPPAETSVQTFRLVKSIAGQPRCRCSNVAITALAKWDDGEKRKGKRRKKKGRNYWKAAMHERQTRRLTSASVFAPIDSGGGDRVIMAHFFFLFKRELRPAHALSFSPFFSLSLSFPPSFLILPPFPTRRQRRHVDRSPPIDWIWIEFAWVSIKCAIRTRLT